MLYQKFNKAIEKALPASFPILGKKNDLIRLLGTGFFINNSGTFVSCSHVIDLKKTDEDLILLYENKEYFITELFRLTEKDIYIGKIDTKSTVVYLKFNEKEYNCLQNTACSLGFPGYGDTDIIFEKDDLKPIMLFSKILKVNSTYDEYFKDIIGNRIIVSFYDLNVYLNPGLSGGPTFNIDGTVCGINFMSSILQAPHSDPAFARIISARAIKPLLIEKNILSN